MEWADYKSKANKMFMEVFNTEERLLPDHYLYDAYINIHNKRVTWFEIKTGNFDRALDWLKQQKHEQLKQS